MPEKVKALVALVESLIRLKREHFTPPRDLIAAFTADEEAGLLQRSAELRRIGFSSFSSLSRRTQYSGRRNFSIKLLRNLGHPDRFQTPTSKIAPFSHDPITKSRIASPGLPFNNFECCGGLLGYI